MEQGRSGAAKFVSVRNWKGRAPSPWRTLPGRWCSSTSGRPGAATVSARRLPYYSGLHDELSDPRPGRAGRGNVDDRLDDRASLRGRARAPAADAAGRRRGGSCDALVASSVMPAAFVMDRHGVVRDGPRDVSMPTTPPRPGLLILDLLAAYPRRCCPGIRRHPGQEGYFHDTSRSSCAFATGSQSHEHAVLAEELG